jgi:hypothetical protein
MKWALIVEGIVIETTDIDPDGRFVPELVWVECPEDVDQKWLYDEETGEFLSP